MLQESIDTVTSVLKKCPRCNRKMLTIDEFPNCINCGFVDYTVESSIERRESNSLFKGNTHLIKYDGVIPSFNNISLKIEINYGVRGAEETICDSTKVTPFCPFCTNPMHVERKGRHHAVLTKKLDRILFYHFECKQRHVVWLSMEENSTWH